MEKQIPNITIMAVGVDKYDDPQLRSLYGPIKDLDNLFNLLVEDEKTALFKESQFKYFENFTSFKLRNEINKYVYSRSAEKDILIFYFSGHGVPIGRDDFGFCTTDTMFFPERGVLPLSIIKYSELLRSLEVASIIPIVIIDACYSGLAANSHFPPPIEAISTMRDKIHSRFASEFALLCACSDEQFTEDTPGGGVFSQHLFSVAKNGITKDENSNSILSLQAIYNNLNRKILGEMFNEKPRIFIGTTLPEIPFVINTQFSLKSYALTDVLVNVLKVLWNKGNKKILSPGDILNLTGNQSSYGNHNKLSLKAWSLVDTISGTRNRRINKRGIDFMLGKLSVPYKITEDPITGLYISNEKTHYVRISDFP